MVPLVGNICTIGTNGITIFTICTNQLPLVIKVIQIVKMLPASQWYHWRTPNTRNIDSVKTRTQICNNNLYFRIVDNSKFNNNKLIQLVGLGSPRLRLAPKFVIVYSCTA